MIRPAPAPLLDKMGSVPVADLRAKPVFAHLAHGEHDMRVRLRQPVGTDVPMDIEVGDHTAFDEFGRSEEHTSELQSLMRISYDVFCLKKKTNLTTSTHMNTITHMLYTTHLIVNLQ